MKIFSQRWFINALLTVAIGFVSISGYYANQQIQRLIHTDSWIIHAHQVIEVANETQFLLTEAESRITLYLLSNNKNMLKPIPTYVEGVKLNIKSLRILTIDNPDQQQRLDKLEPLIVKRANLMLNSVNDAYAGKNIKITPEFVLERLELKNTITEIISSLNQSELKLLVARTAASLQDEERGDRYLIVTGGFGAILLLLCIVLLNYHLSQRNAAIKKHDLVENLLLESNRHLQSNEERLILATEGSHVGLWDWIPGNDEVYYSPYFKKMLGYTNFEFPNVLQSLRNITHPEDLERVTHMIVKHLKYQVPYSTEVRLLTKSGEYKWFQSTGQALWNQEKQPIRMSGSIVDITQRKVVEQQLKIQYAVAHLLTQVNTLEEITIKIIKAICEELGWEVGAVWMVDSQINKIRNIGYWEKSHGINDDFENKTRFLELSSGDSLPGRVWLSGKPAWIENLYEDSNYFRKTEAQQHGLMSGFCFPILLQEKVMGVFEFYSSKIIKPDMHVNRAMEIVSPQIGLSIQRALTEQALRANEAYQTAVFDSALDSIITMNAEGMIISSNPQTTKIFGYASEELVNTNINKLIMNVSLEEFQSLIGKQAVVRSGMRKNGNDFPVEFTIAKMLLQKEYAYVLVLRDVTERKKIERMKNEFVSVVSHELRTPITSIRGSLGLVLGGAAGELTQKSQKLLEIASKNCDRLLLLINDILDMEKIEAGKMHFQFERVDINNIVTEVAHANRMYGEKFDVAINAQTTQSALEVYVDPARLMQVLTNLVANAIKFSPKNSVVNLIVESVNTNVRVTVQDRGAGIAKEFQPRVFQKFSQADSTDSRNKSGTGLGLSISKAIIGKLGGTLTFYSEPGVKTEFYIDLPIYKKSIKDSAKLLAKNIPKLLICEDDPDQAKYLFSLLRASGFDADVASTATRVKELLAENHYHALLLDLILPDQDGIALIRELRAAEATATLPIIVLSMVAQSGREILNGEALSVLDWLDKPIDMSKLLATIARIKPQVNQQTPRILHIEDDVDSQKAMRVLLEDHAQVVSVDSLREAQKKLEQDKFDVVILDVLLPDGNGMEFLPALAKYQVPVIVFSAVELDAQYAKSVADSLVKSENSHEKLIFTIKHLIENARSESPDNE